MISWIHHLFHTSFLRLCLVQHYSKKLNIPVESLQEIIHWRSLGKSRKDARLGLDILLTKWVSSDTKTGQVMVQIKHKVYSRCLIYDQYDKNTLHILHYQSEDICSLYWSILLESKVWLDLVDIHPSILWFLSLGLTLRISGASDPSSDCIKRHCLVGNHYYMAF